MIRGDIDVISGDADAKKSGREGKEGCKCLLGDSRELDLAGSGIEILLVVGFSNVDVVNVVEEGGVSFFSEGGCIANAM